MMLANGIALFLCAFAIIQISAPKPTVDDVVTAFLTSTVAFAAWKGDGESQVVGVLLALFGVGASAYAMIRRNSKSTTGRHT